MNEVLLEAFRHSAWATRALVTASRGLSVDQLREPGRGFGSILETLKHIVECDAAYATMIREDRSEGAIDPRGAEDLDEIEAQAEECLRSWQELLSEPLDAGRRLRLDKGTYECPVSVVVAQALHHAGAHREQIRARLEEFDARAPDVQSWAYANHTGRARRIGEDAGPGETTEDYLREVTIGDPEVLDGQVLLAPPDSEWPRLYDRLAARIRAALADRVLQLEHVGSTSVPGLSAKPTIDIVLVVADTVDEPSYVPPLEDAGFDLHLREPDWFEHRLVRPRDIRANVHVFSAGCEEIDRMLRFRDWLRGNAPDRTLYEETKQELARRTWKYTQHYADAKSQVVQEILGRALGSTGRPVDP